MCKAIFFIDIFLVAAVFNGFVFGVEIECVHGIKYTRKVHILHEYCDALGRKIDDIELSWSGNFLIAKNEIELNKKISTYGAEKGIYCTYDNCIEVLQKYIDVGCTQFIFVISGFNDEKETFMEEITPSFS